MARRGELLGAHDRGRGPSGSFEQLVDRGGEGRRRHVIGEAAERIVDRNVWRAGRRFSQPAERLAAPEVIDPGLRERALQRLGVVLRPTARPGNGANVDEALHPGLAQHGEQRLDRPVAVADREEHAQATQDTGVPTASPSSRAALPWFTAISTRPLEFSYQK